MLAADWFSEVWCVGFGDLWDSGRWLASGFVSCGRRGGHVEGVDVCPTQRGEHVMAGCCFSTGWTSTCFPNAMATLQLVLSGGDVLFQEKAS